MPTHLLSAHDHGAPVKQRHTGGNRERCVWDAAHDIKLGTGDRRPHGLGHLLHGLSLSKIKLSFELSYLTFTKIELRLSKHLVLNVTYDLSHILDTDL